MKAAVLLGLLFGYINADRLTLAQRLGQIKKDAKFLAQSEAGTAVQAK